MRAAAARSVRLTHLAASVALSYPDEALTSRLPALRQAATTLPRACREPLGRMLAWLHDTPLSTVARHYVETFDLRRRCCLYLSYYTHGDTRRRGIALLRFRETYRLAGLEVSTEELPDHLAVVLELSAAGHPDAALDLLVAHRAGLDLLAKALHGYHSPFADAVDAVRATLPPPRPSDVDAAHRLAADGPPIELVGITGRAS